MIHAAVEICQNLNHKSMTSAFTRENTRIVCTHAGERRTMVISDWRLVRTRLESLDALHNSGEIHKRGIARPLHSAMRSRIMKSCKAAHNRGGKIHERTQISSAVNIMSTRSYNYFCFSRYCCCSNVLL